VISSPQQKCKFYGNADAHQTAQPNDGDDLVGVVDRLPGARPQRMADGVVALAGYGHQGPGGDGHGGSCKKYGV